MKKSRERRGAARRSPGMNEAIEKGLTSMRGTEAS